MTILGDNLKTRSNARAAAIVSHDGSIFWAIGGGVHRLKNNGTSTRIRSEGYEISSMVVDPLAGRLYYSLPSLQVIRRVTLSGELELTLDTAALPLSQLVLSSEVGRICGLSLDTTVVCTDLRGGNMVTAHRVELWDDKKIVSIALDRDTLFMAIHSQDQVYKLFSKNIEEDGNIMREETFLSSQFIHGNLHFIDRKVMFLENKRHLVSLELDGNGRSSIDLKSYVDTFYLYQEKNPEVNCPAKVDQDAGQICVVPGQIPPQSVKFIRESTTNISLLWEDVGETVSAGTNVSYTVLINIDGYGQELMFRVDTPLIANLQLPAHTECRVTITASSLHADSARTSVQLTTPQSPPSSPTRVAVYWTRTADPSMTEYTIRWTAPDNMNGDLLHYVVSCTREAVNYCEDLITEDTKVKVNLTLAIYNISVAGETLGGVGPSSLQVTSSLDRIHPEPRLVLAVSYPPAIHSVDVYSFSVTNFPSSSSTKSVEYLSWSDSYLILTEENRFRILNKKENKYSDIVVQSEDVSSMTIDHYGHYVYFATMTNILRLNLDAQKSGTQEIYNFTQTSYVKIDYHHNTGKLILLKNKELYKVHISPVGKTTKPEALSQSHNRRKRSCSCPESLKVDTFAIIPNQDETSRVAQLVLRDSATGNIHMSDETLCQCNKIGETKLIDDNFVLKSDLTNIYIMSRRSQKLQIIDLISHQSKSLQTNTSSAISAFGPECALCHASPNLNCLKLDTSALTISVVKKSSMSVVLSLPSPRPLRQCRSPLPLPATHYRVTFSPNTTSAVTSAVTAVNPGNVEQLQVTLYNLHPNTVYTAGVTMSNIYTMEGDTDLASDNTVQFRTIESSPSSVQNLSAVVESPTTVSVSWAEPQERYSDHLVYEVHWSSEQYSLGSKINKQLIIRDGSTAVRLEDLQPGAEYALWVVAKSGESGLHTSDSVSDRLQVKMFAAPAMLEVSTGAREMNVTWVSPPGSYVSEHYLQYFATSRAGGENLTRLGVQQVTGPSQVFTYHLGELTPGRCYMVQLQLRYLTSDQWHQFPPNSSSICHYTSQDVPLVPGTPYITTKHDRCDTITTIPCSYQQTHLRQLAVEWHQPSTEAGVQYQLQQRHEILPTEPGTWTDIYSDKNNFFILTGLSRGSENLK